MLAGHRWEVRSLDPCMIVGTGKSYIVNINFNPWFKKDEFSDVQIEVKPDAQNSLLKCGMLTGWIH